MAPPVATSSWCFTLQDMQPPPTPLAPSSTYSPAQLAGSLGVLTYTLVHPHSLKVLHHRHTALQPMVWLQLLHSNPYTHTYTENRVPHPGKTLEIEFNQETGQTALVKHRAWSPRCNDQPQFTCNQPLPFLYSYIFACLVVPKPSQSTPFTEIGSSSNCSIISLAQSQNTLPLYPTMSRVPLGRDTPQSVR